MQARPLPRTTYRREPLNVNVDEVEAAQVPNVLQDEDYAVSLNSNYAISAGLELAIDALAMEDGTYVNVLVCKGRQ